MRCTSNTNQPGGEPVGSRARQPLMTGLLSACLLLPGLAAAGTYYVAKHGSDASGNGSQGTPWLTIQHAVSSVQSGDSILVGGGTYPENVTFPDTVQSVTLKGGHNTNDWSWSPAQHPTIVSGSAGARIKAGTSTPATNITLSGLTLAGVQFGVHVPYHQFGKGSVTISACVITNQGSGFGIYGESGCDFTIINTVVAKAEMGIYHVGGAGITGENFIFNCTFATNRRANIWMGASGTTYVRNTISYGAWRSDAEGYGINAQLEAHPIYISHSLVNGNTRDFGGFVTLEGGLITNQPPQFVSLSGGNFRLANGSPGIDAGTAIAAITNDALGLPRPMGSSYDIGAYEWMPPPSAPSGLTATAVSTGRIDLAWNGNADSKSGYRIERRSGTVGAFAEVATAGPAATAYEDTGLLDNTLYTYRTRAYSDAGESDYSNEASASTLANVRYVAKHGSNTNPGTQEEPWETIQYAVTNVISRYVIRVGEGLYEETVRYSNGIHNITLIGGHSTNDWSWNPPRHPTVLKPVAEVGILFAKGWEYGNGYDSTPSTNPVLRGFTINGGQYGIGIPWCNQDPNPVNPVTISHCIFTNQSFHAIFVQGAGVLDLRNSVIGGANGMGVYGVTGPGDAFTHRIYNCTFVNNRRANVFFQAINSGHIDIRNSIILGAWGTGGQGNEGYGIATHTNFNQTLSISYSLLYANTVQTLGANIVLGDGMITNAAPLFVDADARNYRLQKMSPGHNTGTIIESIVNDLDLNKRPMGGAYDMGAYEVIQGEPGMRMIWR